MTLSEASPYDWQHEVVRPELFAGRAEELALVMEEVSKLASADPIAPMVAIVGERRVGKSSLLLRVKEQCEGLRILAAKISLDVVSSADPWEFWHTVFHAVRYAALQAGALGPPGVESPIGFTPDRTTKDEERATRQRRLEFEMARESKIARTGSDVLQSYVVEADIKWLSQRVVEAGLSGLVILVDEAHWLSESFTLSAAGAMMIKQQLRRAVQEAGRCGIVMVGEPALAELFSRHSEPLFAQGRLIELTNFRRNEEVAACALLPLNEDERRLMSPMTVEQLARLSQGKPNQIRLICDSIYMRHLRGDQQDLNISIDVLEDVIGNLSLYLDYDLRGQTDAIRKLDPVALEVLHNITRYPRWSIEDIVDVDESFRGERREPRCDARRAGRLAEKRANFVSAGLMSGDTDRFVLAGDEFLYLYVRFLYEIRKYGELSRRVVLGQGPRTPFGEKVGKLALSLAWDLGQFPGISRFIFHSLDKGTGDVIGAVRSRFATLDNVLKGDKVSSAEMQAVLEECLNTCELVKKEGDYHLLCLSLVNLDSPRELLQLELYFDTTGLPLLVPMSSLDLIRRQAEDARILIQGFDDFIVRLPDLAGLLKALGAPALDEIVSGLGVVDRWRFASVEHLVHRGDEDENAETADEGSADVRERQEWIERYEKGDPAGAEECLNLSLADRPDSHAAAKMYNDRGYIRYGLGKVDRAKIDEAKKDFQRAIDLHYEHLPVVLVDLSVIDIDERDYPRAIERIEDALLLTFGRQETEAAYLRLRLAAGHLVATTKVEHEQKPANVIEACYINLGYALMGLDRVADGIDALLEGLSVLPSSARLKHAIARMQLCRKRADLADPIYAELSQMRIQDRTLANEVEFYCQSFIRKKKRRGRKM